MDFKNLLIVMTQKKGSDLFVTAGRPPCIKIDGVIRPMGGEALSPRAAREIVYGVMNEKQRQEFEQTKECQFAINVRGVGRFRASALVQRDEAAMVLRRIETRIPTIEGLGLPPIIRDLAMIKRGMIIFAGGAGTGKSTSLAAMIGYRNRHSTGHIITVEDPIEFVHEHDGCIVTQREVGVDTESFGAALKNTPRQAPDVILIGEVRTRPAMEYASAFAESGHLVLTSLHANSASQALERIINFFPENVRSQLFMDLSLNLKAIVSQQLVPRKGGEGRRAVTEVLLNTPLAADMIRRGEVHKLKELMKRSREQGMITQDQAIYDLYQDGEITYEDALKYADSANEVRLMIKLHGTAHRDEDRDKNLERISLVEKDE